MEPELTLVVVVAQGDDKPVTCPLPGPGQCRVLDVVNGCRLLADATSQVCDSVQVTHMNSTI
jgi:hypothetical protein